MTLQCPLCNSRNIETLDYGKKTALPSVSLAVRPKRWPLAYSVASAVGATAA